MSQPPTRRRFLRRAFATLFVGGIATGGYTWGIEPHWVEYVRRDLPIAGLPAALEGKTLVQLSDLHIGPDVDDGYLVDHFRRVRDLRPDIVVVTGDWMTCSGDEQVKHAARIATSLPRGTLATAGILGNHDYGRGYRQLPVADKLAERLQDDGIRILRNQTLDVLGLTIAGVEDLWCPRFRSGEVLERLASNRPNLVLCHNPDTCDRPVWHGYKGWVLSGHTHGGQCKVPLFRPPCLPVDNKRYVAGEYDLYDGRRVYINRGLGHLLRVRLNVRPEVTVFTLRNG